jgi:AraC-like DNA-binding protein
MVSVVRAAFEHVRPSPQTSWKYYCRSERIFPFGWHVHDECELTLIVQGRGSRFVGDSIEAYDVGDLVLLGPSLPHTYVAGEQRGGTTENTAVVVQFRPDFLGAPLLEAPEFRSIGSLLSRSAQGLAFTEPDRVVVESLLAMAEMEGLDRTIALLSLLATLAQVRNGRRLASDRYSPATDATGRANVDAICTFLAERYSRQLSLAEMADVVHMAPTTFEHFFHRTMGRSVTTYLIELRIAAACRLLVDTDDAVAHIAAQCGYANISNFNRQFRRLKEMTPLRYRRAFRPSIR